MAQSELKIKSGGREHLDHASQIMARIFATDPAINYMLCSMTPVERTAYLPTYMRTLFTAAVLNSGVILDVNDWSCCVIWMPPGKHTDNIFTLIPAGILSCLWKLGVGGCRRMLLDFQRQSDACKRQGLAKNEKYHYLFFVGTEPEARGQGLCSRIVAIQQDRATTEKLPIWLEATTSRSRDIYLKLGFIVVRQMTLGKGTHSAAGEREAGGQGVPLWAMIWRPPGTEKRS